MATRSAGPHRHPLQPATPAARHLGNSEIWNRRANRRCPGSRGAAAGKQTQGCRDRLHGRDAAHDPQAQHLYDSGPHSPRPNSTIRRCTPFLSRPRFSSARTVPIRNRAPAAICTPSASSHGVRGAAQMQEAMASDPGHTPLESCLIDVNRASASGPRQYAADTRACRVGVCAMDPTVWYVHGAQASGSCRRPTASPSVQLSSSISIGSIGKTHRKCVGKRRIDWQRHCNVGGFSVEEV